MSAKDALSLELPAYRHLPGINPRPEGALLESVVKKALPLTEDCTAISNVAWHYGIRLFNAAYYWEAHEVLEAVWINALPNSRERYLLQAVIHLSNARLKACMQRHGAVVRLQQLAIDCIDRAFPSRAADSLMGAKRDQLQLLVACLSTSEAGVIKLF